MQIPLVDLHAQYKTIKLELLNAIEEVLEGMQLFLGPNTRAFENEFAAYCGCEYGVSLANGTEALVLALRACDIVPGDEVITVANTFIATVEAIAEVGATPVFVDVDAETYTMNAEELSKVVTARTRAVIPVHLYGQPVEMEPVIAFARTHGLWVIEDASQAHGATYQDQRVGSIGDIGCFSFYFSKNLGAYGEAGICVSNNATLADKIRLLRDHGSRVRYKHEVLGSNARMDELQAAVLRVKLKYLDQWNLARKENAQMYTQLLQGVVEQLPVTISQGTHVYYVYVVQVQERDLFCQRLREEGIATGIHYPVPIHMQSAYTHHGYAHTSLPVTEAVTQKIVSLPMYPELTSKQIQTVVDAVKKNVV